ncbi:MAG: GMC family oxidoreductase [Gemmatimonadaceae bacterium]|nr:GMC family oxidoreductase [Gemmatimonadaceae bacterium]
MPLSPSQLGTLGALADVILEGAPPAHETRAELLARCANRLDALPPHRQRMVGTALDVLGSPVAVLFAGQPPRAFAALPPDRQQRCLAAWTDTPLAPIRSAWQSVRRLVLLAHYARPEVAAATGYRGPFRQRQQLFAWEGPLPAGEKETPTEPVARGPVTLPGVIEPAPLPPNVTSGQTLAADVHRRADVVVIGTGAGGAVTAALMAEAGYDVVVLEGGSWLTPTDFNEDEAALTERLFADGGLRTTDDASVTMMQGAAAGGGTLVNWMIMLRTPDFVLDQWAREHGAYGMTPRDMAAVFDRVERDVRAGLVPEDGHSANNRLLLDGARALGWRVRSGMINAQQCVRCGFCSYGCRHGAKQSTLLTYLPRAFAAGAQLYTDAPVERVDVVERDTGTGTPPLKRVAATTPGGRRILIEAPVVVLAAGAVGTPVLLQRSGLGGGGVGQWLRLHPTTSVNGVYDRPIDMSSGIPLTTMCDEFLRWQGTDYGFWLETPPLHPSFTAAAMPGFGAAHAAQMTRSMNLGVLIALTRDGAERSVSSGRVRVNRRGETSITYRLTHEDEKRVRASLAALARVHFAAGASAVETMHANPLTIRTAREADALTSGPMTPNRVTLFSAHVNGTCRMGTDRETSGATPDGERHGTRGLYITDGSLLPTALGVNPQETIMSLSMVLTERMAERHRGVQR